MIDILGRLQRLWLLMRCIFVRILFGKAVNTPQDFSTIIVVLTGKLGDIVCGTPVLRAIRANLPNVRIIAVGGRVIKSLLSDSDLADEYIDIEEKNISWKIKSYQADAAFVTGPSFIPSALLYSARIPLVVSARVEGGFSPSETWPYKILQHFIYTYPYKKGEYAPRERLRALESIGIVSNDTKKVLGFSDIADKKIDHFFVQSKIDIQKDFVVGITPSAGNKIKEWPEKRFAEVADYLVEKHKAKIVLIGGPDDKQKVQNVIKNIKNSKAIINTQGKFNVDELKSLISKLKLFIAVDTGPIYIAETFNIPTIDIVGPMNEKEQPPQGFIHRNVIPPEREKPELSVLNARLYNKEEAKKQTLSVTSTSVIEEIDKLIHDIRVRKHT